MAATMVPEDVVFHQRLLRAQGLYEGDFHGTWDGKTEKAAQKFEELANDIKRDLGAFDDRTEGNVKSLALAAQREARKFMRRLQDANVGARIISGTRTYAQQDKLFRRGREDEGRIVTNARGGKSNHNFGVAWDIGIFTTDGGYVTETGPYNEAAEVGLSDAIEWGGHWESFPDPPHYQLKIPIDRKIAIQRFESGDSFGALD